jgi:HAE1 family hydrophobic/amphiphilic exporter-1
MVALMGLVMKNGILLVDYANQAIERGQTAKDAMLEAGQLRLKPVLMTAASTIFGMIPIAIATSDGAEFRTAMGIIVIGGLLSSTLLTLFVVPTVYTLFGDVASLPSRLRQQFSRKDHKDSRDPVLP